MPVGLSTLIRNICIVQDSEIMMIFTAFSSKVDFLFWIIKRIIKRILIFADLRKYSEFVIVLYEELQLTLPMMAEAQPNSSPDF